MSRYFGKAITIIWMVSRGQALGAETSVEGDEGLKKVLEIVQSPDLQAISSFEASTLEYAEAPEEIEGITTRYAELLSRITGKPEDEYHSQIMDSVQRHGVRQGLLSPMLATYDQVSFLRNDAGDLVAPLIARLNPKVGDFLNKRYGSQIDVPEDYKGYLDQRGDIFKLVATPLGRLPRKEGETYISKINPFEMYERPGNPDNDGGGRPVSGEGGQRAPSTDEQIERTFKAALYGFGAVSAAVRTLGAPQPIQIASGVLGAVYGIYREREKIIKEKNGTPQPPPPPPAGDEPSNPLGGNDPGEEPDNGPESGGDNGNPSEGPQEPKDGACEGAECPRPASEDGYVRLDDDGSPGRRDDGLGGAPDLSIRPIISRPRPEIPTFDPGNIDPYPWRD